MPRTTMRAQNSGLSASKPLNKPIKGIFVILRLSRVLTHIPRPASITPISQQYSVITSDASSLFQSRCMSNLGSSSTLTRYGTFTNGIPCCLILQAYTLRVGCNRRVGIRGSNVTDDPAQTQNSARALFCATDFCGGLVGVSASVPPFSQLGTEDIRR